MATTRATLPLLTITNAQYFRDDGLYINSPKDSKLQIIADANMRIDAGTGTLDLVADTTISLDSAAITMSGASTLTTGTGTVSLSGSTTLAANKYLGFTAGTESFRIPNDGVLASGNWSQSGGAIWKTYMHSSNVCGWLRVKSAVGTAQHTLYIPLWSSATWGAI